MNEWVSKWMHEGRCLQYAYVEEDFSKFSSLNKFRHLVKTFICLALHNNEQWKSVSFLNKMPQQINSLPAFFLPPEQRRNTSVKCSQKTLHIPKNIYIFLFQEKNMRNEYTTIILAANYKLVFCNFIFVEEYAYYI